MSTTNVTTPVADVKPDERTDAEKRRIAYNAAEGLLREKYRDEFVALVKAEAKKLGVEYNPRPAAEEKAEKKMQALLKEFPALADKIGK